MIAWDIISSYITHKILYVMYRIITSHAIIALVILLRNVVLYYTMISHYRLSSSISLLSNLFENRSLNCTGFTSQTVDFSTLSRFRKSIEVMELDMLTSK